MNQFELTDRISKKLQPIFSLNMQKKLVKIYRDLHQHPELSFEEKRTADKLYDELKQLEPLQLKRFAKTGIIARIKGGNPRGLAVAIRGDIDALPIQEDTGLKFSSVNKGVMHACGHDVHATWAIGAAFLLTENPAIADVQIILQPAEEIAKGALAAINAGALDDVSAIFGAHVDRNYAVGQVVAEVGAVAASTNTFEIELIGSGGHGARPHESQDPIVAVGALIGALQTIVSRRLNPALPAVVSICTVNAGKTTNIIPDRARLTGTVRATNKETRKFLLNEIRSIAEAIAKVYQLQVNTKFDSGTPPIVNRARPIKWARQAITSLLGKNALVPLDSPNMGGEDFSFYLEKIPGCFLRVGVREHSGHRIAAHSPHFYTAEESIFIGAAVLAETARIASASLNQSMERKK